MDTRDQKQEGLKWLQDRLEADIAATERRAAISRSMYAGMNRKQRRAATQDERQAMKWTSAAPIEDGYYWRSYCDYSSPEVVRIVVRDGVAFAHYDGLREPADEDIWRWAGPVQMPEAGDPCE